MDQMQSFAGLQQLSSLRACLEAALDRRDEKQARLLSARIDWIQLCLWQRRSAEDADQSASSANTLTS